MTRLLFMLTKNGQLFLQRFSSMKESLMKVAACYRNVGRMKVLSCTHHVHVADTCASGCYGEWFLHRCRTLCEGPIPRQDPLGLSQALPHYLADILECRVHCVGQLGKFPRDTEDDLLTSYFRYLQFSYYQCEPLPPPLSSHLPPPLLPSPLPPPLPCPSHQ